MNGKRKETRIHEWRWMFSPDQLEKAEQYVAEGRYRDFYTAGLAAGARIGGRGSENIVSISSSPASYSSQGWQPDWLSCTCSHSQPRRSLRNRYWDFTGDYGRKTCAHEAALLLLWEEKRGPWLFEETEEEKEERFRKEAEEREQLRIKRLVEQEKRRRDSLMKSLGNNVIDPKIFLDSRAQDTSDCFFDMELPAGIYKTTEYATLRAAELLGGSAEPMSPSIHYGRSGEQEMQIRIFMKDNVIPEESNEVEVVVGRNGLLSHYCSCKRRVYYYGSSQEQSVRIPLCEHELALYVRGCAYVKEHDPGDATDRAAKGFLNLIAKENASYTEDKRAEAPAKIRNTILEPLITIGEGSPTLSFKIGEKDGKMYQLKSLRNLADAFEQEGIFNLGKNCDINFKTRDFTEESEPVLGFLMQRVSDNENVNDRISERRWWSARTARVNLTNKEVLEGATLDRFYDVMEDRVCGLVDKKGKSGRILVGHKPVHMEMRIAPLKTAGGRKLGVEVNGEMPLIIKGSMGSYMLDHTALSRISKEEERALRPFSGVSDPSGKIHFTIGLENLAEFYYRVIPKLMDQPFMDILDETGTELEEVLPPEGSFTFRIDRDNGAIICVPSVSYGDEEIRLMESAREGSGYRDVIQEDRVVKAVTSYFPVYSQEGGFFFCEMNDENAFRLLDEGIDELNGYGKVLGTDAFQRMKLRPVPAVTVGVRIESNLLDLEVSTKDISPQDLLKILDSYQRKKKYYRIRGGEYISLTENEGLDDLIKMAEGLNVTAGELLSGDLKMPAYRALYLDRLLEEHDAVAGERDRTFSALVKNFKSIRDAEYELPDKLKGELRNYQVYGYKWLSTLSAAGFGGILADEMGLGKTIQAIALFEAMREAGLSAPILVVCPASLVYNWQEEIGRFAPLLRTAALTGSREERKGYAESISSFDPENSPQVCVISYDLLRRDIALYDKTVFAAVIIDEAQYIKNQRAAMTKAVKGLKAERRFALTGTPIENRLAELWSIFDFLMPGFLYDYQRFSSQFETPIVKGKDTAASEKLRAMVGPFILRRLKQDVLKDLPEKLEEVRYAKLEDVQQKIYDAQVVKMKNMIGEDKMKIFAELIRLREICCDPSLILEDYSGSSAKREACLELIESAIEGGHRMLLFSQFTSMLSILEEDLSSRGIAYYKITGATPKEERLRLVHRYNDGDVPVFLISLKAGGTGLNLTGADVVIHYDPWWNLAVQNQATDRAHRIGQQKKVTVYRMIAKNTIEEKILRLQEAKKDLAEEILSGGERSIYTLTNDELLELLS